MSATSAPQDHPARALFDSNWVPGLITEIVHAEQKRRGWFFWRIDTEKLKQKWADYGCPNVVRLIDYFVRTPSLVQFGSGSIDISGVMQEEFSVERAMSLQELYIGDRRRKLSPLRWLAFLAEGFERVPTELRSTFDSVCGSLVTMAELPATPCSFDELDKLPQRSLDEVVDDILKH